MKKNETFGERVKYWREKRDLSQEALASIADMSLQNLCLIENGMFKIPEPKGFIRLCLALDVKPSSLLNISSGY